MDTQNNTTGAKLHLVPFHDDTLVTLEHQGTRYVAMARVVEDIGMSWGSASLKLRKQQGKFNSFDIETLGADGKLREMLCIPVEKLALWLATINPNKVRVDLRPKVERYQAESAIALHDYWTKGFASRDGSAEDMAGLRRDMDRLMGAVAGLLVMHDDRRAALDLVSVRQVLDTAKVPSRKRNSINRRVGRELQVRALEMTARIAAAPTPERGSTRATSSSSSCATRAGPGSRTTSRFSWARR